MLNRSILVANSDDCDPHAGREACQACALCTQEGIMQACRCCWSCNALYCRQVHSMVPSLFNQLCPCVGTYRSVFLHLNAAQRKWWPILIYSMYCSLNCKARTNFLANSTQRQQLGFSAKNMCIVHQNSSVHDGRELIIWHCTFQSMAHHYAANCTAEYSHYLTVHCQLHFNEPTLSATVHRRKHKFLPLWDYMYNSIISHLYISVTVNCNAMHTIYVVHFVSSLHTL